MHTKTEINENHIFSQIKSLLLKLGFSGRTKGFNYISHAIYFGVVDKDNRYSINKGIFPQIANLFETQQANIEKTSRHALDDAYLSGGLKQINSVLGFSYLRPYEKPTLTNFISTMIERSVIAFA